MCKVWLPFFNVDPYYYVLPYLMIIRLCLYRLHITINVIARVLSIDLVNYTGLDLQIGAGWAIFMYGETVLHAIA